MKNEIAIVFSLTFLAYWNVINAPFLHDDHPAILNNLDVQSKTSFWALWRNDFWGTPISSNTSHKSYRPLTVLFFRSIHTVLGNSPLAYHVSNIALHSLVSVLFYWFCRKIFYKESEKRLPLLSGVLFGLHPIHTEAVCGIVGCAELLSAICFMTTLTFCNFLKKETDEKKGENNFEHQKKTKKNTITDSIEENASLRQRKIPKNDVNQNIDTKNEKYNKKQSETILYLSVHVQISLILSALAMLCKESGITILGVIIVFDFLGAIQGKKCLFSKQNLIIFLKRNLIKLFVLFFWVFLMLYFRMWIMDWTTPVFSKFDNPVIYEKNFNTRFLTHLYIYWCNFRLLLFPFNLCYDYSFSTIPFVKSVWDSRNILSFSFLLFLILSGIFLIKKKGNKEYSPTNNLLLGYILMIVPFLPASNLFFPVGFVIAERILYLPSAGFIVMLVSIYNEAIKKLSSTKLALQWLMFGIVLVYFVQTVRRTKDWTSKERLFRSGVKVAPQNAKIRYNWANYLRDSKQYEKAIKEYEAVLKLEPSYVSAINNLATVLEETERSFVKVEELFARAVRINPHHENGYNNLARILMKQRRHQEATKVLLKAIQNVPGHLTHVTSLTEVLIQQNKLKEAEQVLSHLLNRSCLHRLKINHMTVSKQCPEKYFLALQRYSELLLKRGKIKQSLYLLNEIVDRNSSNLQINIIWAKALFAYGDITEAIQVMLRVNKESETPVDDVWIMASQLFQIKSYENSKVLFKAYIQKQPNNYKALKQYALLLLQTGEDENAQVILKRIKQNDEKNESEDKSKSGAI